MNLEEYIDAKVDVLVKDDRFDVHELFNYHLTLELSDEGIGICVVDAETLRCLRLEFIRFQENATDLEKIQVLNDLYEEHSFLQAGYWKTVQVAYVNALFTLMPYALFDASMTKTYLGLNVQLEGGEQELHYRHKGLDIVSVFAVPDFVTTFFKEKYPQKDIVFSHFTSAIIESILRIETNSEALLSLQIKGDFLVISLRKKDKLEYCNVFKFRTEDDILYYLVFVISELQLNQETLELHAWSDDRMTSSIKTKFEKYLRNVKVGQRPSELKYGYFFDEVEEYRFNSLLNLHLCD